MTQLTPIDSRNIKKLLLCTYVLLIPYIMLTVFNCSAVIKFNNNELYEGIRPIKAVILGSQAVMSKS